MPLKTLGLIRPRAVGEKVKDGSWFSSKLHLIFVMDFALTLGFLLIYFITGCQTRLYSSWLIIFASGFTAFKLMKSNLK